MFEQFWLFGSIFLYLGVDLNIITRAHRCKCVSKCGHFYFVYFPPLLRACEGFYGEKCRIDFRTPETTTIGVTFLVNKQLLRSSSKIKYQLVKLFVVWGVNIEFRITND